MKTSPRPLPFLFVAASIAGMLLPTLIHAGPDVGSSVGTVVRVCPAFVPKATSFTGAKANVTNTSDPSASFGNKVVVTGGKERARLSFESSFTGPDTLRVTLRGRDLAKTPGSSGGTTPRRYLVRGIGPASVTANSFGTKSGVGKVGRYRARFAFSAVSLGGKRTFRLNVKTSPKSPIRSGIRMVFRD